MTDRPQPKSQEEQRRDRLSAKLRANLQRRKQQARARREDAPVVEEPGEASPAGDEQV